MKKSVFILIFALLTCLSLDIYSQQGWITQNSGTSLGLTCVTFLDSNIGYIVGASGTIKKTTNGGTNWFAQNGGTSDSLFSVFFLNQNTGMCCGKNGTLRRTTNGGINWFAQTSGTVATLRSIQLFDVNTAVVVGYGGEIRKTTNAGTNWFALTSGTSNNLWSSHFINSSTGTAVGFNGTVKRTTNSGANWITQSTSGGSENVCVSFINDMTGFIGVGQPPSVNIYKTTNGGANWMPSPIGTVHSIRSICFINENTGMLVGDQGDIFRTTNSGQNWINLSLSISNWLYSTYFINSTTGWAVGTGGIILKTTTAGSVAPTAPSNLIGFPINSSEIFLAWFDNSNNEQGFKIERSINNPNSFITVGSVAPNVLNFIDDNLVYGNTYYYRVYAYTSAGNSDYSNTIMVLLTDVEPVNNLIPKKYNLYNNYPNPFNPSTKIKFDLPENANTKLEVYDQAGEIKTILVNRNLNAGQYEIEWNANSYSSGIYYYRLTTNNFTSIHKMVLVK